MGWAIGRPLAAGRRVVCRQRPLANHSFASSAADFLPFPSLLTQHPAARGTPCVAMSASNGKGEAADGHALLEARLAKSILFSDHNPHLKTIPGLTERVGADGPHAATAPLPMHAPALAHTHPGWLGPCTQFWALCPPPPPPTHPPPPPPPPGTKSHRQPSTPGLLQLWHVWLPVHGGWVLAGAADRCRSGCLPQLPLLPAAQRLPPAACLPAACRCCLPLLPAAAAALACAAGASC